MKKMKKNYLIILVLLNAQLTFCQFSKVDSLRGSITPERVWWDVLHYSIFLDSISVQTKSIKGEVGITFKVLNNNLQNFQLDLQAPLQLDSALLIAKDDQQISLHFQKISQNVYWISKPDFLKQNQTYLLKLIYHGKPREAVQAPWDGGIVWSKDLQGKDFIASACQGVGASSWWPCKDHGYDEPQNGATITIDAPKNLTGVSNGKLIADTVFGDTHRSKWEVQNPINNYGICFSIANYTRWDSVYVGEKGDLAVNFYVLPEHLSKSKTQFQDVFRMFEAFEHWFGPYPFYEDGYKIIEVPFLGMEHQSAVAYGNGFSNGYLGTDLSGTGWGLKFDFIIIHESGHEWFGNNITASDIADMWIHEGFTCYSESLFLEYFYGKKAAYEYVRGIRQNIKNDVPIIGDYDVHHAGSGDMYYKGANIMHMIRKIVNNDDKWLTFLRTINQKYHHKIVSSREIEQYFNFFFGINFKAVFDQYLRTKQIPKLEITQAKKTISYRWVNCIPNFDMSIDICLDGKSLRIYPTTELQHIKGKKLVVNQNYYIQNTIENL